MSKTVVVNLGNGDLAQGFPQVTVRFWTDQYPRAEQFVGRLPAIPALAESYRIWQSTYRALCDRMALRTTQARETEDELGELEIETGAITQVSQVSFEEFSQQLHQQINTWFKSDGFLNVEQQLRSHLNPSDEIRVIVEATDDLVHRLPWHCWDFFRDYPYGEIALSRPEYQRRAPRKRDVRRKVRILAVLGDRRGIDVEAERQLLQGLADAELVFLVTPSRQEFDHYLWDQNGWDILFFAGHSQTEGETGRIYINENPDNNSLTVEQLEEALRAAIENGLMLAIFNSCDGVGLAQALGKLHIPHVIVMREPVPNRVAQVFLKYFLEAFASERLPLYQAMQQARRRLQGLEHDFPGASWLPVLCQNPSVEPITWLELGGVAPCPYRGLFAFQEADAHLFFGREQVTDALTTAVKLKPLVAVVGPSGSGKSSVVFAGLVPRLRHSPNFTGWQIISCRPGTKPLDALAEAFIEWETAANGVVQRVPGVDSRGDRPFRLSVLELAVNLQQNRQALCERINRLHRNNPGIRLLLIVDQLEELYTLCSETDRQPFLDTLLDAVELATAFTLILTLRADFYGYALSNRRLSDRLQGSVYNLGPMSREELQRAIAQPAAQMQVKLESGLTDKLIQATWGQAGRLPLLEFALTELWSQQRAGWLTHQAYDAIGGVEEALANHAERVYGQLHPLDQQRMQRIFLQLVEPGAGTEPSRRLATQDEVGETNWDLVSHLASARLVVTDCNEITGEETVEVVHEALIRSWGRLERWLQIDGEFRSWQEDLRRARQQWEARDRDEEMLLRGKRLADAREWYDHRLDDLSSGDRQFIQRSLSMQEREYRQRRRRRQFVLISLITGLLVALMLAATAWWGWQNAASSEVRALSTSSNALFVSNKRLEALVESLRAWQKLQKLPWANNSLAAQVEGALRQATYGSNERNRLSGHQDFVYGVAFSPDNQLIATASGDQTVKLWQKDGTLLATLTDHTAGVYGVTFSSDGELIATAGLDGTAKLWQRDGTLVKTLQGHQGVVYAARFSPNGEAIATTSFDGQIKLWQRDGRLIKTVAGQSGAIYDVAFSLDGQYFATAGEDGTVKLWQLDGTLVKTLSGHTGNVYRVTFSPDGRWIASAGEDATVRLWTREGTLAKTLEGHSNRVFSIAFSPDSQTLASASRDKTAKLWGRDGSLLTTFTGHDAEIWAVAFSSDGQTLATASSDQTVRLWEQNDLLTPLVGHDEEIWAVAFSPNGHQIATASQDSTVKLWQLKGDEVQRLNEATGKIISVAFSGDGILAGGGQDQVVWLWRSDGTRLDTILRHGALINAIAFSPNGQIIATAGGDHRVKLWQRDGRLLQTLKGNVNDVFGVAFSPDGQVVASAGRDKTIHLWRLDGTLIRRFNNHNAEARAIAFSPDGQMMAVASWDKTVKLWRLDGTLLKELSGHGGKVNAVAFSADGQTLASASDDQTIRLWRPHGMLLNTLKGHSGRVNGIAFSPDQQTIASVSDDQTVILWHLNRVLDLHPLLVYSCDWVRDYLRTNLALKEGDRQLCRKIGSQ